MSKGRTTLCLNAELAKYLGRLVIARLYGTKSDALSAALTQYEDYIDVDTFQYRTSVPFVKRGSEYHDYALTKGNIKFIERVLSELKLAKDASQVANAAILLHAQLLKQKSQSS